jgi:plastocyanin
MRCRAILVLSLLVGGSVAGTAHAQRPLLEGKTGPGFTITLERNGKKVRTLKPGTYRIRIDDRSGMHDFALRGPGLNRKLTGVAFQGTRTVTVRLRKGRYTFLCSPHADSMRGSFVVR